MCTLFSDSNHSDLKSGSLRKMYEGIVTYTNNNIFGCVMGKSKEKHRNNKVNFLWSCSLASAKTCLKYSLYNLTFVNTFINKVVSKVILQCFLVFFHLITKLNALPLENSTKVTQYNSRYRQYIKKHLYVTFRPHFKCTPG